MEILDNSVVFKLSLTINVASVIWNIISDCDEVYNYWEPLHYLLHKDGFQTWEYSPQYGLRSYLYLYLYGWIAMVFKFLANSISKKVLFYSIRLYMAFAASIFTTYLYDSLRKFYNKDYGIIAVYSIFFLILSAGSFICCTAFLPSSFAFYCSIVAFAGWLNGNHAVIIGSVALSTLVGWPFSAAIGIPFAIDIVFAQRELFKFFRLSFIFGAVFVLLSVIVDSSFYGILTFPALNIIRYNVFNSHGSELYGVESVLFYLKNYFLNFNISVILCLMLPIWMLLNVVLRKGIYYGFRLELIVVSILFLWNAIFFIQPHKEERFLFPCYPFFCIAAGVSLCKFQKFLLLAFSNKRFVSTLSVIFIGFYSLINMSRIAALVMSYHAPVSVYLHLNDVFYNNNDTSMLCLGREWHRFPSRFFLPQSMNVSFIQSDFHGQLPAHFQTPDPALSPTSIVHPHFNDMNEEILSRYVKLAKCDLIIDRTSPNEDHLPDYLQFDYWERTNVSFKMLNPYSIGSKLSLFRSFYFPFMFERSNEFVDYGIWKKIENVMV